MAVGHTYSSYFGASSYKSGGQLGINPHPGGNGGTKKTVQLVALLQAAVSHSRMCQNTHLYMQTHSYVNTCTCTTDGTHGRGGGLAFYICKTDK